MLQAQEIITSGGGSGRLFCFVLKMSKGRSDTIKLEKILQGKKPTEIFHCIFKVPFFKTLYKTQIHWGEKQALLRPH